MNKLQASLRDSAAKAWRERKVCYRVGSFLKGCENCGDWFWDERRNGRRFRHFTSGFQVFRSYAPSQVHWTYVCWECGAKDYFAWANPKDIGCDAIVGSRSVDFNSALVKNHPELLEGWGHTLRDALGVRKEALKQGIIELR